MRVFVLGLIVTLGLTLVGCSTGTSSNPPTPPDPPTPKLTVTAPEDGSTTPSEPVTISVNAANIDDTGKVSVLLNGVDLTARLGAADSNDIRSMQVGRPDINYGKNQIQVRYGDVRTNSAFTLDTVATGGTGQATGSPVGASIGNTLLVPIRTRVIDAKADPDKPVSWGIQVGDILYPSPQPIDATGQPCTQYCYGYQIVMLNRQDLSLVSNIAYEVATHEEIHRQRLLWLRWKVRPPGRTILRAPPAKQPATPGCQPLGCVMVMQSLARIGYNPCYNASTSLGVCEPFTDPSHHDPYTVNWILGLCKPYLYQYYGFATHLHSNAYFDGYTP